MTKTKSHDNLSQNNKNQQKQHGQHEHDGCCQGHQHQMQHSEQTLHGKAPQQKSSRNLSPEELKKHEPFMKRAIELSRKASLIDKSGGVFGAVVVKNGKIIAEGTNQVKKTHDPTWHAEIQAIREASKKLGTPHLEGCDLYTSAECCPLCLAAAYWAHIGTIYYGATIQDALKYGGFDDSYILDEIKKNASDRKIKMKQMMAPEAVEIWKEFAEMPDRARY